MSSLPPTHPPKNPLAHRFKHFFRRLLKRNVQSIHQRFFRWYNTTFFPITDHLTPTEIAYINRCFDISDWFSERAPESDYDGFSYFTYSHRVSGDQINSSRIAFGSVAHPDEMLEAALPVFKERRIEIDPYFLIHENARFYGLGWDIDEGHFKVYFRLLDLDALPHPSLQRLLADTLPKNLRRSEGLVSFTYTPPPHHEQNADEQPYKQNANSPHHEQNADAPHHEQNANTPALYEEKVYAYPLPSEHTQPEVFPGAKSRVLMATSRRGVITQYDVSSTEAWRHKINPTGQKLIDTYAKNGYTLDTIVLTDPDHFTLYFPGAFIPLLGTVTRLRGRA